jgi:methyl-coenzyme M reductase beta subunit
MMINHLVALANNRTLHAVALGTIMEQGAETERGDCIGWYERYQLLASAYQGFNANNLVLDLVKENHNGTVADVIHSMVRRALEDGVLKEPMKNEYPYVQPSGFKLRNMSDFSLWNAYGCAAVLAASIVNGGAARSAQGSIAAAAYFGDMLGFETGLPDPDVGRHMGTSIGYQFYTHGIYGGAGPGAFTMEHVITRSSSGFVTPCAVAGCALDAGTQIFKPSTTSGLYYLLADFLPVFKDPMEQLATAAESIKDKI